MAIALAKGYDFNELKGIAVLGSEKYCWSRFGFREIEEIDYGDGLKGKVIVLSLDSSSSDQKS
jgi:hypothetical protein